MAATARDTRSNPTPKYYVGEKVLCYEPDPSKARVMYEAKVLEVDITKDDKGKKIPEYFIHFSGWNKSWDRWVMEDQVQKNSESNRSLMVKLHEYASKVHKRKRKLTAGSETKDSNSTCKVEKEESDEQAEKPDLPKVEIEIPSQLKLKLEDDCYFIKRKKKLVQLPRKPNVLEVLEDYYEHCVAAHPEESKNLVRELVDGLRIYFDFTLPTLLLYNFERDQYRTVTGMSSDTPLPPMQSLDRTVNKDKDNDGVVSSSTESVVTQAEAIISSPPCQTESREEEAKTERILRRRTLRSQPAEASQSSAVSSSTSSSPERHAESAAKTKMEDTDVRQPPSAAPQASTVSAPLSPLSPRLNLSASKMPSQVYGPEHLLRLFVKLPGLLARNNMEENNLITLLEHVDDLLRYLAEKSTTLFPEKVYFNALL